MPNVPVQRRAATRTVRGNRLFGGASAVQAAAGVTGIPVKASGNRWSLFQSISSDPSSRSFSSRRIIFPEAVRGTESTNWMPRGTL